MNRPNTSRPVHLKAPSQVVFCPFVLVLTTLGCGGATPGTGTGTATAHTPRECAATLTPRSGPVELPAAAPARLQALSQLVVHVEAPLATLGDQLEGRIDRRLGEGHFDLGPAGRVRYSAERGAVTFSVRDNQLIVQTPVHARAAACRGESCYASCEPEAVATAQVPLLLRRDYGFEHAKVALRFTRGCKVKALGGFLTVDLTPTLASELQPVLARVASQIDEQLRNVREDTEQLWQQLSMPRELPLGAGCLVLQPHGIVQGPLTDSTSLLHARFAVLARPELRTPCVAPPSPSPLPALERDLSLPEEGKATLGLVTPLESLQRALASAPEIATDRGTVHVSRATLGPLGGDVVVELTLGGELCGELAFAATPSFAKDGAFIGLSRPRWLAGERARLAAQGLNPDHLLRALAAAPRLPPLLSVAALRSQAATAKMLSTPDLDFSAEVSWAQGAGAAVRETQLVAWIELAGRLDVRPSRGKKLPLR